MALTELLPTPATQDKIKELQKIIFQVLEVVNAIEKGSKTPETDSKIKNLEHWENSIEYARKRFNHHL